MIRRKVFLLGLTVFIFSFLFSLQLYNKLVYASEKLYYKEYLTYHKDANKEIDEFKIRAIDYSHGKNITVFDHYLLSGKDSSITYSFHVPKSGLYNISAMYKPVEDGNEIARTVYINSEIPFKEAAYITFERFFKDKDEEYKKQKGNQTFPTQVEVATWREKSFNGSDGYTTEPFQFYLKSGENTLTIESVEAEMMLEYISFKEVQCLPQYESYLESYKKKGYAPISGREGFKIQGEDAFLKTAPSLYPINDRTSSLMEPYHPSHVVLNAIGGYAWRIPGQMIEWEVEAPAEGLYKIGFKYKQADIRGTFSTRTLRINGEIPFEEVKDIRFNYSTDFILEYLGNTDAKEDYYFYLNEGKNTISLEVSLGIFGDLASRVEKSLNNLNRIYRDIIIITGTSPDKYRDYQLNTLLPNLTTDLKTEREELLYIIADISNISDSFTSSTTAIDRLIKSLNKIINKPNNIASYLTEFKGSITGLGDWMISIQRQPLTIDFFVVAQEDYTLPRAKDNFLEGVLHSIKAFIGSFTNDFNVDSSQTYGNEKNIDVWVSTGRDQFQILRRLVNETFSVDRGINVNLKLVDANVIFPATLTGNGPDVNIQVAASTPINFGYRDGAYDLTNFEDFEEIALNFLPATIDTFKYKGACYALPDQMSFPVMFYRTDIFEELSINVPRTLDEFLAIVPILQKSNMDIYFSTAPQTTLGSAATSGTTKNINPIFLSLLYQNGGKLYLNEGEKSDIASPIGIDVFKYWTELYTKHNFIVETDFATRFRMGEIPVGIVDFTVFNTIAVSAPEIKGDWAIAQIPGTLQEDGSVRYDTPVTVSGSLIVKNIAEKRDTLNESWEFLKWWTSSETQYSFASEMEAVLGLAGRYPVANLEAFKKISWGKNNLKILENSLDWVRSVPQVPGSYITGRVIENAFLSIVTESKSKNPTDTIYHAVDEIDQELTNKRKEFRIE